MRCPACHQSITETEAVCRHCGFSLEALSAHLGIPPQLSPPIADLTDRLTADDYRKLGRCIRSFEMRFPQVTACLVVTEIPPTLSAELNAFWLFNRTSLFSEVEKGGHNHGLLLLLDAASPRAAAMLGYGLEPFIPETSLEAALQAAAPSLRQGQLRAAAETFFHEIEGQWIMLSQSWPQTFGYSDTSPWFESGTGEWISQDTQVGADLY